MGGKLKCATDNPGELHWKIPGLVIAVAWASTSFWDGDWRMPALRQAGIVILSFYQL